MSGRYNCISKLLSGDVGWLRLRRRSGSLCCVCFWVLHNLFCNAHCLFYNATQPQQREQGYCNYYQSVLLPGRSEFAVQDKIGSARETTPPALIAEDVAEEADAVARHYPLTWRNPQYNGDEQQCNNLNRW